MTFSPLLHSAVYRSFVAKAAMKHIQKLLIFSIIFICHLSHARSAPQPISPVLLIPGVGGTVLQVEDLDRDIWVSFESFMTSLPNVAWNNFELPEGPFLDFADNDFRKYALGLYRSAGEIAPVFTKRAVTVPYALQEGQGPSCKFNTKGGGLCGIQYVVDFLETPWEGPLNIMVNLFTQFATFNNYAALIQFLELNKGLEPGRTLFGFPYDWRHSVRRPAMLFRLDQTLKSISRDGARPVSIVSHSMGGLIVKAYINYYQRHAEKYIKTWIALGSPFQGAGGDILSSFFSGFTIGNISICNCTARQLAVQSPATMEMMPPENSSLSSNLTIEIKSGNERKIINGTDSILNLIQAAYTQHQFKANGKNYAWPLSTQARDWAKDTRTELQKAQIPSKIKIYAVYGSEVSTPFSAAINMKSSYEPSDLICEKNGCAENTCTTATKACALNFSYQKGDGMVTAESAANPYGPGKYSNLLRYDAGAVSHENLIKPVSGMYEQYAEWLGLSP